METKFENDLVAPSDWTTEFLGDRTEDWSRGKETRNQDILVKMLNNKHSLQSYHKLFLLLYYINSSKYLVTTGQSIKNVWIASGYWSSAFQLSDLPIVETPKSCRLKNKSVKDKYVDGNRIKVYQKKRSSLGEYFVYNLNFCKAMSWGRSYLL